jgi:uncharacterized protein YndB with AHSA1/START domain
MTVASTDRIEKKILLSAPRTRVWKALTDAREFGHWFGVQLDGPFVAGATVRGVITPTAVDSDVARAQEPHAGKAFEVTVEQIEPERLFSFRWHPYAIDSSVDYSREPTTLIVFTLEDAPGGIMLTLTESGFDRIPLARRAEAFTANDEGWAMMVKMIEKHLAQRA